MKHHYLDAQLESGGEEMISYSFEHVKVLDVFFQYSEHFTGVFCKLEICYWLIEKNVTCLYLWLRLFKVELFTKKRSFAVLVDESL
jgi:hypothetical protein